MNVESAQYEGQYVYKNKTETYPNLKQPLTHTQTSTLNKYIGFSEDNMTMFVVLEQETVPSVLQSTGWFKERIRAYVYNRTKINWGLYGRLTFISNI